MPPKFKSQISIHGIILLFLLGIMPAGFCSASINQISPTSALPYTLLGNVTYQMDIKVEIINKVGGFNTVAFYAPHMLNWSISVPDGDSNLQTSTLLGNKTSPSPDIANYSQIDQYNNSIDYLQRQLFTLDEFFTLTMNYTIVARQIRWNNLGTPQMADYDTGSPLYHIYTQNQPSFIDITDPNIVATAQMICGGDNNPVDKARAIYNWVSKNLTYEVQTIEMGASWAIANHRGDCSEFSDLMVAMLREQGVPARKVVGIGLLDANGNRLPSYAAGATWTYVQQGATDNYTGHAWVEYYVPGCGWVACDPTWGNSGQDYFNYIDYLHISSCRGEYMGNEVYPYFSEIGEYPFLPLVSHTNVIDVISTTHFTVVESNIWVDNTNVWIIVVICIVVGLIGLIFWAARRRPKKSPVEYERY